MALSETQLALHLTPKDVYQLENYYFCKPELEQAIDAFCQTESIPFLFLVGHQGVGKTHLLMAVTYQISQLSKRVHYLSCAEIVQMNLPDILLSIEHCDVICLDDIQVMIGNNEWEEALFHLFNRARSAGTRLVMSSTQAPSQLVSKIPDLQSRLSTALIYQLPEMVDEQKQQALIKQAQWSGMMMTEEVAQYLLRYQTRDMQSLIGILKQLDKASLQQQRKLTVPFVRRVLSGE